MAHIKLPEQKLTTPLHKKHPLMPLIYVKVHIYADRSKHDPCEIFAAQRQ